MLTPCSLVEPRDGECRSVVVEDGGRNLFLTQCGQVVDRVGSSLVGSSIRRRTREHPQREAHASGKVLRTAQRISEKQAGQKFLPLAARQTGLAVQTRFPRVCRSHFSREERWCLAHGRSLLTLFVGVVLARPIGLGRSVYVRFQRSSTPASPSN